MKYPSNRFKNSIKAIDLKRFLVYLLLLAAISGAGGTYYFYGKYRALKANPDLEAQKETESLVSALGKLMELPQGETPTIATISDKEKLKDQSFFKAAENGDRLFAYNTAMLAVLYRPRTKKIINVAPITIDQRPNPEQEAVSDVSAPAPLRVAYYNGTGIVGLSGLAEKAVREKYPDVQTSALENASRKDYKETLVVDLSGKHGEEAGSFALFLNGKIGVLPQGEIAPDADILIIIGK